MTVDLAVVGLGYVGLPLARHACAAGLATVGYDISTAVVHGLNHGRSPVHGVADTDLAAMRMAGFTAQADPTVIGAADAVVICVPTGLTPQRTPDLSAVLAASHTVAEHLRPGMLVVLESTSYPGTTEEIVRPVLERVSGLVAGIDFHLAYSPERVDPGNTRFAIGNTPKIVSGHTPLCAKYCATFYGRFIDTVVVARGSREAEMAKLLENTYRYVNIALVNELAMCCEKMGIDLWDVLHCASTKPFGFAPFTPGPGVGGHCIPIDPIYLSSKAETEGFSFNLLAAARGVNDAMPRYVADRAVELLSARGVPIAGAGVLLLGVTYKPNVPDTRESPAVPIARRLRELGAAVSYHDPYFSQFTVDGVVLSRVADVRDAPTRFPLTILLQDHDCYDIAALSRRARFLFDTRGKAEGEFVARL